MAHALELYLVVLGRVFLASFPLAMLLQYSCKFVLDQKPTYWSAFKNYLVVVIIISTCEFAFGLVVPWNPEGLTSRFYIGAFLFEILGTGLLYGWFLRDSEGQNAGLVRGLAISVIQTTFMLLIIVALALVYATVMTFVFR